MSPHSWTAGFGSVDVCKMVGISYRQLDYWCRSALVYPEIATGRGSGSQRRFSHDDVKKILFIKVLMTYTSWEAHYAASLVKAIDWRIVEDGQIFMLGLETKTLAFFDPKVFQMSLTEAALIFRLDFPEPINQTKETL